MRAPILVALFAMTLFAQGASAVTQSESSSQAQITVGGGCFWCVEAVFDQVAGVHEAESGYAGGHVDDPDYRSVCDGVTGHAEVVRVTYDPEVVSVEELLLVFFGVHDPTTLNRQGADVGTQYRSIILAHDEAQEDAARALLKRMTDENVFDDPIVTQVERLERFWPAEEYHQDYFRRNQAQGYCQAVIAPKLAKFRKEFATMTKRR